MHSCPSHDWMTVQSFTTPWVTKSKFSQSKMQSGGSGKGVGLFVGNGVGTGVGDSVGTKVGDSVGNALGDSVGTNVGDSVGTGVG